MSYLRQAKRAIPRNTNYCKGCKHRQESTGRIQTDIDDITDFDIVRCNFLNIRVDEIDADKDLYEHLMNFGLSANVDIDAEITKFDNEQKLFRGEKICGVKPFKKEKKNKLSNNKNTKSIEPKLEIRDINIDDDDIPF